MTAQRPAALAALAAFTVLAGLTGACSSATGNEELPADSIGSVTLAVHDLTAVPGTRFKGWVRVRDTIGWLLDVQPEWTSTAPDIALVDSYGAIWVRGSGTARIIARMGSRADTLRIEAAPVRFTGVGHAHERTTCGVTEADDVYCWGELEMSNRREAGWPFPLEARGPVKVAHVSGVARVTGGAEHFCALANGAAVCWGSNLGGTLGLGTTDLEFHPTPTAVPGHAFTDLDAGYSFTCGLEAGGDAYCWGDDWYGQLGDGSYGTARPAPVEVTGGIAFRSLAAGNQQACGLDGAGVAYCWGDGSTGMVGPAAGTDACIHAGAGDVYCTVPVPVDTSLHFTAIDLGWMSACGLTSGGTVYCWGSPYGAQPVPVGGAPVFASVATGGAYACALTVTGEAWCWGQNVGGQLGNGQVGGSSSAPVAVAGGHAFSFIRAGAGATCGLTTGGRLYCWGANFYGEVGDGSDRSVCTVRPEPTEVAGQR